MFALQALLGGFLLPALSLAGLAALLPVRARAEAVWAAGIVALKVASVLRHANLLKVLTTTCCEVLRIKTENVVR